MNSASTPPPGNDFFLVFHDQLNRKFWPAVVNPESTTLLFLESAAKGKSLPYHKKKLVFVLSAQRHFVDECRSLGFKTVLESGDGHYDELMLDFLSRNPNADVSVFEPSEYDSRERLRTVSQKTGRLNMLPNPFFLADATAWTGRIKPGFQMEVFYRHQRRTLNLLMDGTQPEGGSWNFDINNRKRLPDHVVVPEPPYFEPDEITEKVSRLVDSKFADHPGDTAGFGLPVTRVQAQEVLKDFVQRRLDGFGPYEDAMKTGGGLLFHSGLSTALNAGLLLPLECCQAAIEAFKNGRARLESVEAFVRQLIGWREFVRIYYEAMMPAVRDANFFGMERELPDLFWTGKTKCNCLHQTANEVVTTGYTHHIQRLMVLSNFSNLTGTRPRALLDWFWCMFTDAYEWVVLPNVLGMGTYADGGVLATKPYVASGAYIRKMSNFCKGCHYDVASKTGPGACPFNYLYWNFVDENILLMEQNPRTVFQANQWKNKAASEKEAVRTSARAFLSDLERSETHWGG